MLMKVTQVQPVTIRTKPEPKQVDRVEKVESGSLLMIHLVYRKNVLVDKDLEVSKTIPVEVDTSSRHEDLRAELSNRVGSYLGFKPEKVTVYAKPFGLTPIKDVLIYQSVVHLKDHEHTQHKEKLNNKFTKKSKEEIALNKNNSINNYLLNKQLQQLGN